MGLAVGGTLTSRGLSLGLAAVWGLRLLSVPVYLGLRERWERGELSSPMYQHWNFSTSVSRGCENGEGSRPWTGRPLHGGCF